MSTFHEDSKIDVNESKNEKIIYKSCVFLSYLSRIKVSLSPLGMSYRVSIFFLKQCINSWEKSPNFKLISLFFIDLQAKNRREGGDLPPPCAD